MDVQSLTRQVLDRVFIELEASGRHVHLTRRQAIALFGHPLTPKRPLSQPGQYLAQERLTVKGPKGQFENVAVLGPERPEAQVELSLTDARTLGMQLPVRLSGDVENTPGGTLIGPKGSIDLPRGFLAAQRHIHMTPQSAARFGVKDKQVVRLQTFTERPVVFEDVQVRVREDFATYAHLDYDEANACGWQAGDLGRIVP